MSHAALRVSAVGDEMVHEQAHNIAEAAARSSRAKLVAFLAVSSGDLAAAEDALSDAFARALSVWPVEGCPANPEAWLLTVARRKLIDHMRRQREIPSSDDLEEIAEFAGHTSAITPVTDDDLPDRRLALLFACTHPAIDPAVRAPLMLQVVLGLEAVQIASAFLVSPAAMAQRLVRAKTKIRDARIPFRVPGRNELPDRLDAVLDSVYACYSEGWAEAAGADMARRELAGEAIFLGKLLVELLPDEPEAWGLLALMLYAEARRPARRRAGGEFVPFSQQDRSLWDQDMIDEADAALHRASSAGLIGRFQLEAAIQSAHVEGAQTGTAPWGSIVSLYEALVQLTGSPVASINRALALAEVESPQAALDSLDEVSGDPRLASYQPYWAVRANLLARTGMNEQARHAYEIAIGLESDPSVRNYLEQLRTNLPERPAS
jgi:RNA polymerase sigma-70 factor (ECF subfamily)